MSGWVDDWIDAEVFLLFHLSSVPKKTQKRLNEKIRMKQIAITIGIFSRTDCSSMRSQT